MDKFNKWVLIKTEHDNLEVVYGDVGYHYDLISSRLNSYPIQIYGGGMLYIKDETCYIYGSSTDYGYISNDMIMPLLKLLCGNENLKQFITTIKHSRYPKLAEILANENKHVSITLSID